MSITSPTKSGLTWGLVAEGAKSADAAKAIATEHGLFCIFKHKVTPREAVKMVIPVGTTVLVVTATAAGDSPSANVYLLREAVEPGIYLLDGGGYLAERVGGRAAAEELRELFIAGELREPEGEPSAR